MAHQKSFGLGQSKTTRSFRVPQALAQGVWTVLLSSVMVLGVPSILGLGSVNVRDSAMAQTAAPSTTDPSPVPAKDINALGAAKNENPSDLTFAWLPWILGLGLIGLAWWLLKGREDSAGLPVEPIGSTPPVPTNLDPIVPITDEALVLDPNPRASEPTSPANPVGDDPIVAVDHDVNSHGAATVQVSPRDSEGNSGGLKFPPIDPSINPNDVAIVGVAASMGVADPIVPALLLPHEPITQLPPDNYAPLESASPTTNPIESDPTIGQNSPQPSQPDPNGLLINAGLAAGMGAAVLGKNPDSLTADQLADVDQDLPDLASGYGESRIVLMPRDPQWAYTYWDIPDEHRQSVRYLGGQQLALRLYDATDLDLNKNKPHSVQQYACDELARDWYLPIPVSDRDYIAEIGYLTGSGEWLLLARSNRISIPPVYPTDWMDEQTITVDWVEPLQGRTFLQLVPPGSAEPETNEAFHDQIFNLAYGMDQESRMTGSLFGSMHQIPSESWSSFIFPAGAGLWANEFPMGLTASGIGMSGFNMSGIGMSGIGMSGIGMGASIPPDRLRKFWLVADAELIVYGATEPDAQLTIGGTPVKLTPEGTFRIQLSFQDGNLDFPIMAIAKDGEQMRQIRMTFDRNTPLRKTNRKEDATDENY